MEDRLSCNSLSNSFATPHPNLIVQSSTINLMDFQGCTRIGSGRLATR